MNLMRWTPLREFDDLLADYQGMFRRPLAGTEVTDASLSWRPVADISETDKEYVVKAELPGVESKDVSVSVEDGMLKIEGKREWKKESDDEKQHRTESFHGSFARSFTLPDNIDESKIRANCRDGMLKVRLPKVKAAKSETRKIEVQ